MVTNYCLMGADDLELCSYLDIGETTLNRWKNEHPEFREAILDGRDRADARVAASMYQRAKGFSRDEEKLVHEKGKLARVEVTKKYYPPDTRAGTLWLHNRQRGKWKQQRQEHVVNHNVVHSMLEAIEGGSFGHPKHKPELEKAKVIEGESKRLEE